MNENDIQALDALLAHADRHNSFVGMVIIADGACPQPTPQEFDMSQPLVESKTLVQGVDVAKASKDQLIDMLKRLEKEETDLAAIRTESTSIQARIAEIGAARTAVARALDA